NRVIVRCFPIPSYGDAKFRLGIKVPLETTDGKICTMKLPRLLSSNFSQPKRHRVNLVSHDKPASDIPGFLVTKNGSSYNLTGLLKTNGSTKAIASIAVRRNNSATVIAAQDWYSKQPRFIVQGLKEVAAKAPKQLFVVVDTSASLKPESDALKNAIASIP